MVDVAAAISAVVLLALVTMATRVSGVWIMSYVTITPRVEAFLKYMSVSVLISLLPRLLGPQGHAFGLEWVQLPL